MKQVHIKGFINDEGRLDFDSDSCLAVRNGDDNIILAELFENEFCGINVSISYYISDKETTREELEEAYIKKLSGIVEASIYPYCSEITGYLWTVEEIDINGHNLFEELETYKGKYLDMYIIENTAGAK